LARTHGCECGFSNKTGLAGREVCREAEGVHIWLEEVLSSSVEVEGEVDGLHVYDWELELDAEDWWEWEDIVDVVAMEACSQLGLVGDLLGVLNNSFDVRRASGADRAFAVDCFFRGKEAFSFEKKSGVFVSATATDERLHNPVLLRVAADERAVVLYGDDVAEASDLSNQFRGSDFRTFRAVQKELDSRMGRPT